MNNGQNGVVQAMVVGSGGGDLGSYATALAGAGPRRRLDKDAFAAWIRSWLAAGEQRCTGYYLQRDDPEHGRRTIAQGTLLATSKGKKPSQQEEESFVQQLVERFDRASQVVAEGYPRNSTFFVGACKTLDGDLHPIDEFPFNVSPPPEIAGSFHQREEGETSISSVVGTMQRHADTSIRSKDANMQQCMDRMQEENLYLRGHVREQDAMIFQMCKERNELLDQSALRAITVEKERLHMELTHKLYLEIAGYLITLGKAYMRSKTGFDGKTVDSKVVESLQGLDAPNLLKIFGLLNQLPDEQKVKLAPLIEMVSESMTQEKKDEMMRLAQLPAAPTPDGAK